MTSTDYSYISTMSVSVSPTTLSFFGLSIRMAVIKLAILLFESIEIALSFWFSFLAVQTLRASALKTRIAKKAKRTILSYSLEYSTNQAGIASSRALRAFEPSGSP